MIWVAVVVVVVLSLVLLAGALLRAYRSARRLTSTLGAVSQAVAEAGPGLALTRPVPPAAPPTESDLRLREADLAAREAELARREAQLPVGRHRAGRHR